MTARAEAPPARRSRPVSGSLTLLFALTGFGKTTQLCYVARGFAERGQAKIAAPPNAIESFETTTGVSFPRSAVVPLEYVEDVTAMLTQNRGKLLFAGHDDAGSMFEASYARFEAAAPIGQSGNKDAFYAPRLMGDATKALQGAARYANAHVVMTGHLMGKGVAKNPATGVDEPVRGGLKLPNKKLVESITGVFDAAFRVIKDPGIKAEWKAVFSHRPMDMEFATKDRLFGLKTEKYPMNLAELLRFRSYDIPRVKDPKEDKHLEELVQTLATSCWESGKDGQVIGEAVGYLIGEFGQPLADWICYDARSRVDIWRLATPMDPAAAAKKKWGY